MRYVSTTMTPTTMASIMTRASTSACTSTIMAKVTSGCATSATQPMRRSTGRRGGNARSGDEGLAEGVDVQQRADERARAVPGRRARGALAVTGSARSRSVAPSFSSNMRFKLKSQRPMPSPMANPGHEQKSQQQHVVQVIHRVKAADGLAHGVDGIGEGRSG